VTGLRLSWEGITCRRAAVQRTLPLSGAASPWKGAAAGNSDKNSCGFHHWNEFLKDTKGMLSDHHNNNMKN